MAGMDDYKDLGICLLDDDQGCNIKLVHKGFERRYQPTKKVSYLEFMKLYGEFIDDNRQHEITEKIGQKVDSNGQSGNDYWQSIIFPHNTEF